MSIEDLPTDVLAAIGSLLTVKDLKNMRRVCRWAEQQTFHEFASRGYRSITLKVNKASVESLQKVLKSGRLAASVCCPVSMVCIWRLHERRLCCHMRQLPDIIFASSNAR